MNYQTLLVDFQDKICYLKLHRPEANNTINDRLIAELRYVLELCED